MSKSRTKLAPAPRVVASGDGWRIEYSPADKDYAAIDSVAGLLGYEKSETAARQLISRHITGK